MGGGDGAISATCSRAANGCPVRHIPTIVAEIVLAIAGGHLAHWGAPIPLGGTVLSIVLQRIAPTPTLRGPNSRAATLSIVKAGEPKLTLGADWPTLEIRHRLCHQRHLLFKRLQSWSELTKSS